jgi:hypothetical protein
MHIDQSFFMQVLSDALAAGAQLACISETLSQPSDQVCASILDQLPPELASHIRVYSSALHAGAEDPENKSSSSISSASSSSSGVSGGGDDGATGFSAEGLAAAAAARVKQQGAEQFVAQLQQEILGRRQSGVGVTVDAGLLNAGEAGHGLNMGLQVKEYQFTIGS